MSCKHSNPYAVGTAQTRGRLISCHELRCAGPARRSVPTKHIEDRMNVLCVPATPPILPQTARRRAVTSPNNPLSMDPGLREFVRRRAGYACEYCRMPQEATPLIPFHVEHIVSRRHRRSERPRACLRPLQRLQRAEPHEHRSRHKHCVTGKKSGCPTPRSATSRPPGSHRHLPVDDKLTLWIGAFAALSTGTPERWGGHSASEVPACPLPHFSNTWTKARR
jgi:hypothetical protein